MDQRLQFVADHQRGLYAMTELCARYAVSRKTGYKWLARYAAAGPGGSPRPQPRAACLPAPVVPALAALLLAARRAHPTWGPAKLLQYLAPRHPRVAAWPAVSTVADLLQRHGLVAGAGAGRARPSRRGADPHCRAERSVDRGLQGAVPHARWRLLLSAHHRRPAHALLAHRACAAEHARRRRPRRLRARVPRPTGCRRRSAPTTACRSPTPASTG